MHKELLGMWPDDDAVTACIKHEAETVDKAVFLAVHQPMQFVRIVQGAKQADQQVLTEQHLLDEFLQERLPEGRLILPIEGSSGIGKSHVIRWIDAQLERREDRERRHVIRVPKGMSLKGVLRRLLEGLDGPHYKALREELLTAREKLEPELAAKHLILNICHRLEQEGKAAAARIRDGHGSEDDKVMKDYGDVRALPALLGDSVLLYSHWLIRESDGAKGVMARLAEQVTDDILGSEDKRTHQILPEDLKIPQELLLRLNPGTQRFYHGLHNSQGNRLEDAVRLINKVLDPAKQDLLQLGDGSLTDLFREVREHLFRDGKELVLLVEDFAVLSGMQGALLQVMITEAFRDGEQVLCTMRSALAYTEGVAHVPETVRTRARSVWTIKDQAGETEDIHRRVIELVGAYLNAARVGQQGLKGAFAAADSTDWIPCVDGQDFDDKVKEVLRAFGDSDSGYPLFPFNREAVRQLTEQGSRKGVALVFNPRLVINNVLVPVLKERRAFENGLFPHEGMAEQLRSAEVTSALVRSITDKEKQRRALVLLATWGNQPGTLEEAAAVSSALFTAFALPQPTWSVSQHRVTPPPPPNDPTPIPPPVQAGDPKERQWTQTLERWAAGERLDQTRARQLRKWLAEAMLDFGPWGMLCLKLRHNAEHLQSLVYLPRSIGQTGLTPDKAFLIVALEEDLDDPSTRAKIVRTLMAFVRLHDIARNWTTPGALQDAALCASFMDSRLHQAEMYLRSNHFRAEGDTIPVLTEALLVGARALGVEGGESRQLAARVNSLFAPASNPEEPSETRWGKDLARFASHRKALRDWLLEQVGARQGTGAVHAVDVMALETTIRKTANSWLITHLLPGGERDPDYQAAAGALQALHKDLPRTLQQRREELLAWHASATAWFGPDPDKHDLRDALRDTVNHARKDLSRAYEYDRLQKMIANLQNISLKATLANCARLETSEQPGHILSVLAQKPDNVVRATTDLMDQFDKFINICIRELDAQLDRHGEDVVEKAVAAVQCELGKLRGVLQNLQGVAS
jgi:hypothetical protein